MPETAAKAKGSKHERQETQHRDRRPNCFRSAQEARQILARGQSRERARLNIISHLLGRIPYEELSREKVALPKRRKAEGYWEPDYPFRIIPAAY